MCWYVASLQISVMLQYGINDTHLAHFPRFAFHTVFYLYFIYSTSFRVGWVLHRWGVFRSPLFLLVSP